MHTLKIIGWQPYDLEGRSRTLGQNQRTTFPKVISAHISEAIRAPNLTDDKILARFVESPLDLERMNPHFWRWELRTQGSRAQRKVGPMRSMPGWAQHRDADPRACIKPARQRSRAAR